jgi:hypothetical protein
MTQLIITSRYGFSLTGQNRDLVGERLEKVILTGFQEPQQLKKLRQLKNMLRYKNGVSPLELMREGKGNPRLMEILDQVVEQKASVEEPQLLQAIKDEREKFIRTHVIRELIEWGGKELENFLRGLSGYNQSVQEQDVENMAEKAGLKNWQELLDRLLDRGIRLSLIEHDQAHKRYRVTPLLREDWL